MPDYLDSRMLYASLVVLSGWGMVHVVGRVRRVSGARQIFPWSAPLVALLLVALIAAASVHARQTRAIRRTILYEGIQEYVAAHSRENDTIGVVLTHRAYPLFGSDLTRKVVLLAPESDNPSEWVESLRSRGISLVGVGPLEGDWSSSKEFAWLDDPNGPFTRVFGKVESSVPMIYRLKNGQEADPAH